MTVLRLLRNVFWLACVTIAVYATPTTAQTTDTSKGSEGLPKQEIVNQTSATTDELHIDTVHKPSLSSASTYSSRQVQCSYIYYVPVPGPPGIPGLPGINGEPGIAGPLGATGYSGNNGQDGNNGIPGPTGPRGIHGQKGELGFKGHPGIPGLDGLTGLDGYRGESGNIGPRGPPGPVGQPGPSGPVGPSGEEGVNGPVGKRGPRGPKGLPGTYSAMNGRNNYRAFSVALTSNVLAKDGNMVVKWNHEFSNVGGDFDMDTGVFNVTVPGTYFFSFHVAKASRQTYPLVQLVKNGERVVGAIDYGPNDSEDSSGNSVILALRENDVIWMTLNDERELSSSPYKLTTFSGFLIFPMTI